MFSPMKVSKCPFTPTCSNYSIDSFKKYGFFKGIPLSIWRILRCNPFNKGYYDPPEHWAIKLKLANRNTDNNAPNIKIQDLK